MQRTALAFLTLAICGATLGFIGPPSATVSAANVQDEKAEETPRQRLERKIRRLFEINGVKTVQERSLDQIMEQFRTMGLSSEFIDKFKDRFDVEEVLDMNVRVHAEHLEEEVVDALLAFYGTKAGQSYAEAFPVITEESMRAGMEYGQRIGQEVAEEMGK